VKLRFVAVLAAVLFVLAHFAALAQEREKDADKKAQAAPAAAQGKKDSKKEQKKDEAAPAAK